MPFSPKFLFIAGLLFFLVPLNADAKESIPQFCEVAPGVYRGGQPTEEGLKELKAKGIKTIVNFRHEKRRVEEERQQVEALGMSYVSIPWRISGNPDEGILESFLKIAEDPAKKPLFFHCRRGVERTGVMTGVYSMAVAGLSPEAAYEKAFRGFPVHWYWKFFVNQKFEFFKKALVQREAKA